MVKNLGWYVGARNESSKKPNWDFEAIATLSGFKAYKVTKVTPESENNDESGNLQTVRFAILEHLKKGGTMEAIRMLVENVESEGMVMDRNEEAALGMVQLSQTSGKSTNIQRNDHCILSLWRYSKLIHALHTQV